MKNIKFFLILFLSLFIFTLFFFGLKKDINYYPTNFEKKVDFNFNSKDLFTSQNISLNEILKKRWLYFIKYLVFLVFTM